MALCVQCGGSTPPPVEEPAAKTTEEAAPPTEEAPSETAESGEASSDTAPASDNGSEGKGGAKKKCEELDKSTCKVTIGCGWNELKKCVEGGPPR